MYEITVGLATMIFHYIVALAPDFPARSATRGDLSDAVLGEGKAGHPGQLPAGSDDLETAPIDEQAVLAVQMRTASFRL